MIEFLEKNWVILLCSLPIIIHFVGCVIRDYLRARNPYVYKPNAEVEKLLIAHKKSISIIENRMSKD